MKMRNDVEKNGDDDNVEEGFTEDFKGVDDDEEVMKMMMVMKRVMIIMTTVMKKKMMMMTVLEL